MLSCQLCSHSPYPFTYSVFPQPFSVLPLTLVFFTDHSDVCGGWYRSIFFLKSCASHREEAVENKSLSSKARERKNRAELFPVFLSPLFSNVISLWRVHERTTDLIAVSYKGQWKRQRTRGWSSWNSTVMLLLMQLKDWHKSLPVIQEEKKKCQRLSKVSLWH